MHRQALEEYGAQPPIELLRQWMDYGGWYDYRKDSVGFKTILDILFAAGMGPTGGGRNPITPRLIRHFCTVALTDFDEVTMGKIFNTLADWILAKPGYPDMLRSQSPTLVQATLGIYDTIVEKLLPTPEKSHYTFNLRDVSKVFQVCTLPRAAPHTLRCPALPCSALLCTEAPCPALPCPALPCHSGFVNGGALADYQCGLAAPAVEP